MGKKMGKKLMEEKMTEVTLTKKWNKKK